MKRRHSVCPWILLFSIIFVSIKFQLDQETPVKYIKEGFSRNIADTGSIKKVVVGLSTSASTNNARNKRSTQRDRADSKLMIRDGRSPIERSFFGSDVSWHLSKFAKIDRNTKHKEVGQMSNLTDVNVQEIAKLDSEIVQTKVSDEPAISVPKKMNMQLQLHKIPRLNFERHKRQAIPSAKQTLHGNTADQDEFEANKFENQSHSPMNQRDETTGAEGRHDFEVIIESKLGTGTISPMSMSADNHMVTATQQTKLNPVTNGNEYMPTVTQYTGREFRNDDGSGDNLVTNAPQGQECMYTLMNKLSHDVMLECIPCRYILNISVAGVVVPSCMSGFCTEFECNTGQSKQTCSCNESCEEIGSCCYNYYTTCKGATNFNGTAGFENYPDSDDSHQGFRTGLNVTLVKDFQEEVPKCSKPGPRPGISAYRGNLAYLYNDAPSDLNVDPYVKFKTCESIPLQNEKNGEYYVISQCPKTMNTTLTHLVAMCHDNVSMVNNYTAMIMFRSLFLCGNNLFKNIYCALCHEVSPNICLPIRPAVYCTNSTELYSVFLLGLQDIFSYVFSECNWFFTLKILQMHAPINNAQCKSGATYINHCDPTLATELLQYGKLKAACHSFRSELTDITSLVPHGEIEKSFTYKNAHCALCNGFVDLSSLVCLPQLFSLFDDAEDEIYLMKSLFLLFDFTSLSQPLGVIFQQGETDKYICAGGFMFDVSTSKCVVIICENNDDMPCIIPAKDFDSLITDGNDTGQPRRNSIIFCSESNHESDKFLAHVLEVTKDKLKVYFKAVSVKCFSQNSTQYSFKSCVQCSMGDVQASVIVHKYNMRNLVREMINAWPTLNLVVFCNIQNISHCLENMTRCKPYESPLYSHNPQVYKIITANSGRLLVGFSEKLLLDIEITQSSLVWDKYGADTDTDLTLTSTACVDEIHTCAKVTLFHGSASIEEDNLVFEGLKRNLPGPGSYMIRPHGILVCQKYANFSREMTKRIQTEMLVQQIITTVSLSMSIMGLISTLGVYVSFKQLQTHPGLCLMNFCLSLLIVQLLFVLSPFVRNIHTACLIFAVAQHIFWLSSFLWTLVFTYDAFRTFQNFPQIPETHKNLTFVLYMVFAWCLPITFGIICFALDKYSIFTVGYGLNGTCWITSWLALISTFMAPVSFVLFLNFSLLIITLVSISRTMKFSEALNMSYSGREKLTIYFRLASIAGITWIFGFISNIQGMRYMVYPFILCNGSQGIIVCAAFCSSKRVRELCASRFSRSIRHSTASPSVRTERNV